MKGSLKASDSNHHLVLYALLLLLKGMQQGLAAVPQCTFEGLILPFFFLLEGTDSLLQGRERVAEEGSQQGMSQAGRSLTTVVR